MNYATVLILSLEEMAEDALSFMREKGYADLANQLKVDALYDIIARLTLVAVNRRLHLPLTTQTYLEPLRKALYTKDASNNEFVDELIDNLYIEICGDVGGRLGEYRNLYSVTKSGSTLHISLLVSQEALEYGVLDIDKLIELMF